MGSGGRRLGLRVFDSPKGDRNDILPWYLNTHKTVSGYTYNLGVALKFCEAESKTVET